MKNIGIISGGFSSEYEISLKSARNIYENVPADYNSYLIVFNRQEWFVLLDNEKIPFDEKTFTFNLKNVDIKIDFALIYVHGTPGEDGKLQSMFEVVGVPYLNSGPLASMLSFDKWYCNQFLKGFGFKVAPSVYLNNPEIVPPNILSDLGLPVFVKPCDSGSSYGIAKVKEENELIPAIEAAFVEGSSVVVEGFLKGREVTCSVYQDENGIHALPITEIITHNDFFDFEAKYKGLSDEITPAHVSKEITAQVQKESCEIYKLLNLKSLARVDFILVDDVPTVIEVNTIPGFSNESLAPQMIEAAGMTIAEFWEKVIRFEIKALSKSAV